MGGIFLPAGKKIAWPAASISWLSTQSDTVDKTAGSSYSFASISIGADVADRIIAVGFNCSGGGVGKTGDQGCPTLGGNQPDDDPASLASTDGSIAMHYWTGLTGTTATLAIPIRGSTCSNIAAHVFRITGARSSIPRRAKQQFDAGPNGTEALTFDMDVGSVGLFFGRRTSTVTGYTTTNANERFDDLVETNACRWSADYSATVKEIPRTITIDFDSGSTAQRFGGAIWR